MTNEVIVLVDQQDQIIGQAVRGQTQPEDIIRITGLWVTNSKQEVLIAKRVMSKRVSPGCWGAAAGGVLSVGETYDSNMQKEAEEEIGLTGVVFEKWQKIYYESSSKKFCQFYRCVVDEPTEYFTKQASEVDDLAWVDYQTLKQDVALQPEKYVAQMPLIIELLEKEAKA